MKRKKLDAEDLAEIRAGHKPTASEEKSEKSKAYLKRVGPTTKKKALKKKAMPKTYAGKSTKLGQGGRAAKLKDQLEAKGTPKKFIGGIIGKIAHEKQAAPGQKYFHKKAKTVKKGMKGGKGC